MHAVLRLAKGPCAIVSAAGSLKAPAGHPAVAAWVQPPKHLNQWPDRRVRRTQSDQARSLIHTREPRASESSRNARVRGNIEWNTSTANLHLFFLFFARSAKSSSR